MASPSVLSMPMTASPAAPAPGAGQLTRALRDEHTVLEDLVSTLERQRKAVAKDDIDAVNDSVFAAHRLLSAYREARSRRRSAVMLACGGGEGSIDDLPRALGHRMTDVERTASDDLRDAARRLVDAVDVNRRLLQAAMSSGDAFFRLLTGVGAAPEGYGHGMGHGARPAVAAAGARLVDLRG
ncbi:MAG: flagellar export chaperone FlgN [Gemmatimonadales bacterium]|nr:flagellar export chaperone FlgN [Gemmatimonadota bacterium]MCL4214661.1 flagellar export chaperone FlgN [Gemmatimonadales bacterium]